MQHLKQFASELTKQIPNLSKQDFQVIHDRLWNQWYDSFDRDADPRTQMPDYSVYDDPDYIHITQACFKGWSKANTLNIIKFFKTINHTPSSVLDVFGGIGLTSILLAKAFPETQIFYHNTDPAQTQICRELCLKFGISNVQCVSELKQAEVVVALEAMEHILEPIKFIEPILKDATFYIDGSSFTIDSIGHHPKYVHEDKVYDNADFKRVYFKWVKTLGLLSSFAKDRFIHKRFYNGRPNVFVSTNFQPVK